MGVAVADVALPFDLIPRFVPLTRHLDALPMVLAFILLTRPKVWEQGRCRLCPEGSAFMTRSPWEQARSVPSYFPGQRSAKVGVRAMKGRAYASYDPRRAAAG